jgi:hypothetical protein
VRLLDDDDELPPVPDEEEASLMAELGGDRLRAIDVALSSHTQTTWLKVARVVFHAVEAGEFPISGERHVRLHARRVMALVDAGVLEGPGNLLRPRWSEIRLRTKTARTTTG